MKNKSEILNKIMEAKNYLEKKAPQETKIALILGSGLGVLGDEVDEKITFKYSDIPNFPRSTVQGHKGRMIFGKLEGVRVMIMQGRFHYYEGYSMKDIVFPVLVMKAMGIKKIIITNAAGGINTDFKPGDLMLIKDHINFIGDNPLIGENLDFYGPRFPDMSRAYSKSLTDLTKKICKENRITVKEGVYISMPGPAYETPAEIRMAGLLGADAVGMSTVPEVIAANHAGLEVLGISCITNMAAGILDKPLNHKEVVETANSVKESFIKLIRILIKTILVEKV